MKRVVGVWQVCLKKWFHLGGGGDNANGLECSRGIKDLLLAVDAPIWWLVPWGQSWVDGWWMTRNWMQWGYDCTDWWSKQLFWGGGVWGCHFGWRTPWRNCVGRSGLCSVFCLIKVNLSLYRLLGFQQTEGSRIYSESAHESGKGVSCRHRLPLPPGDTPGLNFC